MLGLVREGCWFTCCPDKIHICLICSLWPKNCANNECHNCLTYAHAQTHIAEKSNIWDDHETLYNHNPRCPTLHFFEAFSVLCGVGPRWWGDGLGGYLGEEVIPYKKVEEGTWGPARWQSKSLHAYQTIEVTRHNLITTQSKGHHPGDAVGLVATIGMLNPAPMKKYSQSQSARELRISHAVFRWSFMPVTWDFILIGHQELLLTMVDRDP